MDSFSAMLGALATAVGVGVAFIVHIIRYAYSQGVVNTRLERMEKAQEGVSAVSSVLASLTSTVAALEKSINRLDGALEKMGEKVARVGSGSRG